MLISSILNIILDSFLIYSLWIFTEMGVAAAVVLTVAAIIITGSVWLRKKFRKVYAKMEKSA
ncbi:MAG: hypothetical protein ACOCXB_04695 [Halanaerobium sp.]